MSTKAFKHDLNTENEVFYRGKVIFGTFWAFSTILVKKEKEMVIFYFFFFEKFEILKNNMTISVISQ